MKAPSGESTKKTRIYVVDDHALVRRGLAALIGAEADLELCGEAEDCATATSGVQKLRPDVVIADISLRGKGGLELIKNIQTLDPGIHVVVLSVHDESVYALRVLKAGAKGYVMKQDLASKVIDAVRKVRRGQMYVSELVAGQMLNRLVKGEEEQGDSPVAGLSNRELEVVTLIGSGLATREIADQLRMSVKTVETHRAHIKTKAHLGSATRLVQFCVRWVEDSKRQPACPMAALRKIIGPSPPSARALPSRNPPEAPMAQTMHGG
jgi:DNA-binding NarL/FixJ family response regulator